MADAMDYLQDMRKGQPCFCSIPSAFILSAFVLLLSFVSASCSGKKDSPDLHNVGGGYTLLVSGGTLNDGSGAKGLVILATLRDSDGRGPNIPWTIKITGPGISASAPIEVEYQNHNYMSWEWAGFEPISGTYRATATSLDGKVSIYYDFSINNTTTLARPAPSVRSSGSSYTLTWPPVSGAASYSYEIVPPSGGVTVYGYVTNNSVDLGVLTIGDYLVRVRAYSSNRVLLQALPPQENVSEYSFTSPIGGDQTSDNYSFNAALGIMDYGLRGPGNAPYLWPLYLDIYTDRLCFGPGGELEHNHQAG